MIEKDEISENGEVATIYTSLDNGTIFVTGLFFPKENINSSMEIDFGKQKMTLKAKPEVKITVNEKSKDKVHIFKL